MTDSIRRANIPTGHKRATRLASTLLMAGAVVLACGWTALADPTHDSCDDHLPNAAAPPMESGLATDASPIDTPDVTATKHKWLIERQRILGYLNRHKGARALSALLPHGRYAARVIALDEHAYLIAEARNAGAFIADGEGGQYKVVWDTGRVDEALQCANNPAKAPQVYAGFLPGPHDGSRRFYVMTACAFPGFSRGGARFVLARWHDGTAAKELDRYISYVPGEGAPRLIGQTLHVIGSGQDQSFTQTPGWPAWEWTIAPRPDGFETCDWTPVDRERGVVDRLIDGIDHTQTVSDLAAPEIITRLANALDATPREELQVAPVRDGEPVQFRGLRVHPGLSQWCIRRGRNGRVACTRDVPPNPSDVVDANPSIATACLATQLNFFFTKDPPVQRRFRITFRYRHRQPYVSDVEVLDPNEECRA